MNPTTRRFGIGFGLGGLGLGLLLACLVFGPPLPPTAVIQVVDAAGKPISDALIQPEGLRTKAGPYQGNWYGWSTNSKVPPQTVRTRKNGSAPVPYPIFVFERIETGVLCLSVKHPEFVPTRPECVVATAPPSGAPWKIRAADIWDRIRRKALMAHVAPITLQRGAILALSVRAEPALPANGRIFALVSGFSSSDTQLWAQPEPRTLVTRQLGAGAHTLRAVQFDGQGFPWFSDVLKLDASAGQTNRIEVTLRRGVSVRGQLDGTVPRPVRNGRVVAHVWPPGIKPAEDPPEWHHWAPVDAAGGFELVGLPPGVLEIAALCDGFVSTNGPGGSQLRHPQKHVLEASNLTVSVGMEPTARLEVHVTDERGRPLEGARVETWPNLQYADWAATVLMSDCYSAADRLRSPNSRDFSFGRTVPDFQGTSDGAGMAVLPNLPVTVHEFTVVHPQFVLPAVGTTRDGQRREASVRLSAGQTNRISVQLEPSLQSPIKHY